MALGVNQGCWRAGEARPMQILCYIIKVTFQGQTPNQMYHQQKKTVFNNSLNIIMHCILSKRRDQQLHNSTLFKRINDKNTIKMIIDVTRKDIFLNTSEQMCNLTVMPDNKDPTSSILMHLIISLQPTSNQYLNTLLVVVLGVCCF